MKVWGEEGVYIMCEVVWEMEGCDSEGVGEECGMCEGMKVWGRMECDVCIVI